MQGKRAVRCTASGNVEYVLLLCLSALAMIPVLTQFSAAVADMYCLNMNEKIGPGLNGYNDLEAFMLTEQQLQELPHPELMTCPGASGTDEYQGAEPGVGGAGEFL